jgi:ribosome-associated toxin RatA of RatAB toxin-antitoxin module
MHTASSILIRAPLQKVFDTAADLELWPKILPHYRYIHFYERATRRNVVKMAAIRSGIPVSWVSEQLIDPDAMQVHFCHLKAFTKGMRVIWTLHENPTGVLVEIVHDLKFRVPALAPLADPIIGRFFIDHIAGRTLRAMKHYLENGSQRP